MTAPAGKIDELYKKIKINISCIENILLSDNNASTEAALLLLKAWGLLAELQSQVAGEEKKVKNFLMLTKEDLNFCDAEIFNQIAELQNTVSDSKQIATKVLTDNLARLKNIFENILISASKKGLYTYWTRPLKAIVFSLAALVLITFITVFVINIRMPSVWRVSYYANPNLSGSAKFVNYEPEVSLVSRTKLKKVVEYTDSFSVRFESCLRLDEEKNFNFSIGSDDGSRVQINGKPVIDNWGAHAFQTKAAQITLTKGVHKIVVEYNDYGGGSKLDFDAKDWQQNLERPTEAGACL